MHLELQFGFHFVCLFGCVRSPRTCLAQWPSSQVQRTLGRHVVWTMSFEHSVPRLWRRRSIKGSTHSDTWGYNLANTPRQTYSGGSLRNTREHWAVPDMIFSDTSCQKLIFCAIFECITVYEPAVHVGTLCIWWSGKFSTPQRSQVHSRWWRPVAASWCLIELYT